MDAQSQGRAMGLLGRFNDDLTRVFDAVLGTEWAEIEEMLAISAIATVPSLTTRELAEITRLNRRAVSRMTLRLQRGALVVTRPARDDRRSVEVVLTPHGRRRIDELEARVVGFFLASADLAREIRDGLGSAPAQVRAEPAEPLALLRRVCEAGLALVRSMPDAAREGQLAARQRAALVQIAVTGGSRPQDLSTALEVSRAGVAYVVDQLCAKGFATRRRGAVPQDRRAVLVEVTPAGMQAVSAVMTGIAQQSGSLALLFSELAEWHPPLPHRP